VRGDVDRGDRAEEPLPPVVAAVPAELSQWLGLKECSEIGTNLTQGIDQ
jgi:hypothetical protein